MLCHAFIRCRSVAGIGPSDVFPPPQALLVILLRLLLCCSCCCLWLLPCSLCATSWIERSKPLGKCVHACGHQIILTRLFFTQQHECSDSHTATSGGCCRCCCCCCCCCCCQPCCRLSRLLYATACCLLLLLLLPLAEARGKQLECESSRCLDVLKKKQ